MKRMCKGQAPLFFMLQKKVIYLTNKKNQAGWIAVLRMYPT